MFVEGEETREQRIELIEQRPVASEPAQKC